MRMEKVIKDGREIAELTDSLLKRLPAGTGDIRCAYKGFVVIISRISVAEDIVEYAAPNGRDAGSCSRRQALREGLFTAISELTEQEAKEEIAKIKTVPNVAAADSAFNAAVDKAMETKEKIKPDASDAVFQDNQPLGNLPDGPLSSSFFVAKETGRTSSDTPNLSNTPKWRPPDPDTVRVRMAFVPKTEQELYAELKNLLQPLVGKPLQQDELLAKLNGLQSYHVVNLPIEESDTEEENVQRKD